MGMEPRECREVESVKEGLREEGPAEVPLEG